MGDIDIHINIGGYVSFIRIVVDVDRFRIFGFGIDIGVCFSVILFVLLLCYIHFLNYVVNLAYVVKAVVETAFVYRGLS